VFSANAVKCMYFLLEKEWHGMMKFFDQPVRPI